MKTIPSFPFNMSIDSDLQPVASITKGDRALSLFTDRYSFTRLLAERLNDPPKKEILFFHGAGGNGKSLLLRYLQEHSCKKLLAEQWAQWKTLPDDELAGKLRALEKATDYISVPSAMLDFGPTRNNEQPKDDFYGLLLLRKLLGEAAAGKEYALRFPRYDFACIWYLSHKGKSLNEIRSLFPLNEVAGFATTAMDAVTGNPFGAVLKAFMDFGMEGWSERLTLQLTKRGVDRATQEWIRGLDVDRYLIGELSGLFAEDLNAAMGKDRSPERIVLFFDTHEAFYGRNRSFEDDFFLDEWLRRLLRRLDTALGIVVVVAGRDKPRWAEARNHTHIPTEYVRLESVDDLAASDARIFLRRAEITNAAVQESLICYASVAAGRVHPLHLALCADVVLEAAAKGVTLMPGDFSERVEFREKSVDLFRQLLLYVDNELRDAIRALSACRAFDFEIYKLLGEKLSFFVSKANFRKLVSFSFVRQVAQRGDEWFRIHDLLRRLEDEPTVMRAHEVLAAHYQARSVPEAIYHVNQIDWLKGIHLWIKAFDQSLASSQYEMCRVLLDIRQELKIESPFILGLLSNEEGKYYLILTLHSEALEKFEEAIAAYDTCIEVNRQNIKALNNRGNSQRNIADLRRNLLQPELADSYYNAAVGSFDEALHLMRKRSDFSKNDFALVLNSSGLVLTNWAEMQFRLSQYPEAKQHYEEAIISFDEAVSYSPEFIKAWNNKGLALIGLSELQASFPRLGSPERSYKQAIASCKKALSYKHDYIKAMINIGHALMGWAELKAAHMHYEEAVMKYEEAIASFDKVLIKFSSDDVHALNSNAEALRKLGQLWSEQFQNAEAASECWHTALTLLKRSLVIAPNNIDIHRLYEQLTQLLNIDDE